MKLLLGIKSCQEHRRLGFHDIIRKTWGQDVVGADLRFFMGNGERYLMVYPDDDIDLNCPDDYDSLSLKTIEIVRWAYEHEYNYCWLADTDSFVVPRRLMKCGFEKYDFCGLTRTTPELGKTFNYQGRTRGGKDFILLECWPWSSGGYGYFLSRKMMEAVLATPKPTNEIMVWCEDLFVGQIAGPLYRDKKISMAHLEDYENKTTWHFPQYKYNSGYNPRFGWQEEMYALHKDDQ